MTAAMLVAGLALLLAGAESLVRGASRLAARAGVPALLVGLTVVAYGTSAPELAVSVTSSIEGAPGIAVGNVVGSNIFNVLFILGLSAAISPIVVSRQLVRLDVPLMIGVSLAVALLAADGGIGRLEGAALVAGLVAYTASLAVIGARTRAGGPEPAPSRRTGRGFAAWLVDGVLVVAGLGMLVVGARWFLAGVIAAARGLGVPELIVGLTLVAAGTSLPEVATSVVAAVRGERDIAVGNVVGSNIFNVLGVLGVSSLASTGGLSVPATAVRFDIPVMIAVAVACSPIFFTGYRIARWEGALFLSYYAAYVAFLALAISRPEDARRMGLAIVVFAVPLTAITLAVVVVRALRAPPRCPPGG